MTNESSIILLLQYENNNNNNDSNTNNEQMTIRLLQTTMTNITVSLYHSLVNEPNQMIDDRDIVNVLAPLNQTTMINMTTITELNKNNNKLIYDFDPNAFYGEIFHRLNYEYRNIHGYLSLVVCVFGIIANVLNIIVLTRFEFFCLFVCLKFLKKNLFFSIQKKHGITNKYNIDRNGRF